MLAASLATAALPANVALGRFGAQAHAGTRPSSRGTRLFPRFAGAVPVLLYHRILAGNGRGVAVKTFDAQMRRLHERGFEAITLDQYARFVHGDVAGLPLRPVLITFDDGYLSALEQADPVLARYGWSAVMYIPTGFVGLPGRLTWDQLRQMRSSGRWQIDEHAGNGHVLIRVDAAGRQLPFYANEQWAGGTQETFAQYRQRVSRDIQSGSAILARNLPGWTPHVSFAVPYGDYGQRGSNDPRIEPWLSSYLKAHFAVTFVQRDDSFTTGPGFANRITVAGSWDAGTLETHLLDGLGRLKLLRG